MTTTIHDSLSDKALLEATQHGDDAAAELLTKRLVGKVTPATRAAWSSLRRAKRIGVHAARRILVQADRPSSSPATAD